MEIPWGAEVEEQHPLYHCKLSSHTNFSEPVFEDIALELANTKIIGVDLDPFMQERINCTVQN